MRRWFGRGMVVLWLSFGWFVLMYPSRQAAEVRRNILEELKSLGPHQWAGQYYHGDGLGANYQLMLAPNSGYLVESGGCTRSSFPQYGAVSEKKGMVHLVSTFIDDCLGLRTSPSDYCRIPWGERVYLVPLCDMVWFCNDVNGGREPRTDIHGFIYLRVGDEKKQVSGFPIVPGEFRSYLLSRPIEATIIGVGKRTSRPVASWLVYQVNIIVNRGRKHGLLTGMKLHLLQSGNKSFDEMSVDALGEEQSEGNMMLLRETDAGPSVGCKMSTRCQ